METVTVTIEAINPFKVVFTLGRFGSIKTNSGAIAVLVRVNTVIRTLVHTKQVD